MKSLPLTLIEQYLFHEDRPGFPNHVGGNLRFSGTVKRDAFERAADKISPRYPLLTAKVRKNWRGKLFWEFSDDPKIPIHWYKKEDSRFRPAMRALDITKEAGFEFHIVEFPDGWDVFVNQCHVICDGPGTYSSFHDLLLVYESELGTQRELPPIDIDGLRRRNDYGLTFAKKLALLPMQLVGFFYAIGLVRRKVSPLIQDKTSKVGDPVPENWPNTISRALEKDQYTAFRKTARERKTSVNNLCLAYFHTAIGVWRERYGIGDPKDWIRLSVPVGLRTKAQSKLTACNIFSIVSIDRQAKGLLNRERLVRRSKEDMDMIKKGWLGLTFLLLLWFHRLRPNGIRKMSHRDICRTTAVMTNVGQLYAHSPLAGPDRRLCVTGAKLESAHSIAPIRPYSNVTLQLSLYAGEFLMSMNYDSRVMSEEQANALLDCFVDEIRTQALGSQA